ncbi:hypothetical protein D3C78_807810 [compost metagenome]
MQGQPLLGGQGHAGQQAKAGHAVLPVQPPQQRHGIGLGRRLVGHHQQRLAGRMQQAGHRVADARRGVDQQHVGRLRQFVEGADQSGQLRAVRLQHRVRSAGPGDHLDAARPIEQGLVQRAAPGQDILQAVVRRQPQGHIDVGQGETGVQQHHPPAARRQRPGQVDRDLGLADPALAAGDGDHLHRQPRARLHRRQAHVSSPSSSSRRVIAYLRIFSTRVVRRTRRRSAARATTPPASSSACWISERSRLPR